MEHQDRLTNKYIVLITGGNQGVGYETAKNLLLSDENFHVIIGSRSTANGEQAVRQLHADTGSSGTRAEYVELDVTKEHTVKAAADLVFLKYRRLDALVNNAGILGTWRGESYHRKLRKVLETNVVGAVLMTESFLDLLRNSAGPKRLVFVSSSAGSLTHAADPDSPYYGSTNPAAVQFPWYRRSKAALNMALTQYSKMLGAEGFKVHGADPGLVATDFMDKEAALKRGAVGAEVGGKTVADVVKGERDADVGRVVGRYGVSPW